MTQMPGPEETVAITAPEAAAGARLDKWLSEAIPALSRSRARALVEVGALLVNGDTETDPRAKVRAGAIYRIEMPPLEPAAPEPEAIPLDILFEDEHLLVVNKAAGMAVHPAPGSWTGTLVNALLAHCGGSLTGIGGVQRPGIVHRLDKDTSGVMVVAKSEVAHVKLVETFQAHDIDRAYLALTRGAPRPLAGTIDLPIARSVSDRKKMAVPRNPEHTGARQAVTHYRALETYGLLDKGAGLPAAALLECRLETGRTHQIRVHMSHVGCPLIGDPVYARHRGIKAFGSGPAFDAATTAARALTRQALHALRLGFAHPVTGEALSFETAPPEDFASLRDSLKRWNAESGRDKM
jgi:23S rRNA pseudouridine1911/1915/1917 synthase